MGGNPEGGATHHISNLMGGFNGSTQHYLEIYLQDFEGLNSFVMADSKETKPCLGLIEYSPGQRFFVKEYGLNQLKKCCVDRLSRHDRHWVISGLPGHNREGAARLRSTFNYQLAHLSGLAALVLEFRIRRSNIGTVDIGDLLAAAIPHRQF